MELSKKLVEALKMKYKAEMELASANLQVYLERPAGIGEHPQILDEMNQIVENYSDAKGKLEALEDGRLIDAL